jgi:hypothetical protein
MSRTRRKIGDSNAWTWIALKQSTTEQSRSSRLHINSAALTARQLSSPLVLKPHINEELVDHCEEARDKVLVGPLPQEADPRKRMKPGNMSESQRCRRQAGVKSSRKEIILLHIELAEQDKCF